MSIRQDVGKDQYFLIDSKVIDREVNYAQINENDIVLEIGAGSGLVTKKLVNAKRVYAIEKDPRFVQYLKKKFANTNVEIIQGDALKIKFPRFTKIVSNIPYSISSQLTFKLLKKKFEKAIIIYQREFALRMVAFPGTKDYGRLSVMTQYYAKPKILEIVPPSAFKPQPKVYSAMVELIPRERPEVKSEKFFEAVVRALFQHRRKIVRNALIDSFHEFGAKVEKNKRGAIIEKAPYLKRRVMDLSLEEIIEISDILYDLCSSLV